MNYGLPARPPVSPPPDNADAARLEEDFRAALAGRSLAVEAAQMAEILPILRVLGAYSPYLSALVRRDPALLVEIVAKGPEAAVEATWADLSPGATAALPLDSLMRLLRRAKARIALAAAVGDLAYGWPLMKTTGALSRLASAALSAAAAHALRAAARMNELTLAHDDDPERDSGLIILGMGKLGAHELNYSSDIDLIVFFDNEVIRPTPKRSPGETFVRLTKTLVKIIQERTADGYVFRVDLRLRPDPGAMPVAISTDAAEIYYQSLGQNWERAAMIKARPVAGDLAAGRDFLQHIRPFVWRRHLDFAAVRDIQRMKEKIRDHHGHGAIGVEGQDVKLGPGGIREVEFFVQIQQLISGGREPQLRDPATLSMLDRLVAMGRLPPAERDLLAEGYCFLRHLEHRLQMVDDAQTHEMPADPARIPGIGRFMGFGDEADFRRVLLFHLAAIQRRFSALFAAEDAADPASLRNHLPEAEAALSQRLAEAGFQEPAKAAGLVIGWRVGRYRCFRHERARALVEGIAPVLLQAFARTAEPDVALLRFDQFLSRLPAGVQLFSLLDANRALLDLLAEIMGAAPLLAELLARRPGLLDAVVGGEALRPLSEAEALRADMETALCDVTDYQDLLDAVRRWTADKRFAVGIQLLRGLIGHEAAGQALTLVAEAGIERLTAAVAGQFAEAHGDIPGGGFAVLGFGKLGGRELTVTSDLDLVFVFSVPDGTIGSDGGKPLTPGLYYTRLGQRLISALSALTAEGSLYEVDMALRPAGSKAPLVPTLKGFDDYYRGEAWTWEHLALTRARLVVSTSEMFGAAVTRTLDTLKHLKRDPARVFGDIAAMRGRMDKDRPARSRWDLKLCPGGLVDIEFIAQALLLAAAPGLPAPLPTGTGAMLDLLGAQGLLPAADALPLRRGLGLAAGLAAMLRLTAGDGFDPEHAPAPLKALLARHAGVADFAAVEAALDAARPPVRALFGRLIGDPAEAYVPNSAAGTGGLAPLEE
ncbi:bifunctional [glutamine synthetase] adenylyltransferase/[glutamine synthetase]-adenylyl-L-tyrosine phosphorylase [Zavarzinia compransoris]|uniref:Bifunctional glutamine synthetase adenylyltransferase/adenylyl-removing enzyme n=1 Tax=Zavarzinia compransoris TaxID=1264899 RepID=A0A317EAN0_9PROT|nr:bifunctional [glutamine synthetase] adenylyltransferase/[glutamine synthetase]-adenylyl-L-tyrosine phosphorylase [Zavarzinia compransoris]PWR23741.1 glutamine-synthetase adenylyltransferase [Zavarzinia compransoris]TDP47966.1 glutamate-ammonia-ligase adenylyltransferase [Zavarzinia compransoris]